MEDDELLQLLEQVHAEIQRTETLDDKGRELLQHIGADINDLLTRVEDSPLQPHETLAKRLKDAVDHYEITHPHLTMLLSHLLDSLSSAGL